MSNPNLTEIVVVIDESGSMGNIMNDTIGGFNSFLAAQKESVDGKALLTLVTFSTIVREISSGVDVQEVEPLTTARYRPSGGTALLDAIGLTINKLEDRYTDETDASKIPSKVIFAIITDGEETSSRTFTKAQVARLIKHQTNRHGWEFAFLGANLDAVREAQAIGISSKSSFNYSADSAGTRDVFAVMSNATRGYRAGGASATYDIAGTTLESKNQDKLTVDSQGNLNVTGAYVTVDGGNLSPDALKAEIIESISKMGSGNITI